MRLLLLTWFVIGFAISVHFGCGRDGGQEEPLSITATRPADLEVGVAIETKVRARLSADIDQSTLNAATFTLFELDGAQVAGTVEIDQTPDVAVFTPNEPLELNTIYAATITAGLASTDGRVLEEPFTWSFETLDSAWGVAELIEENNFGSGRFPQVATDAEGNAFAVWQQSDGVGVNVWANRYTRSDLWGDAELIGLPDAGDAGLPQLAVDPSGVAHAIWAQRDPEDAHIYTSRYAPSNGNWSAPELVQTNEITAARDPQIGVDAEGNAIAVWIQLDDVGSLNLVWANRYTPGGGWGQAEPIETRDSAILGLGIDVAVDANGNAVAVWTRSEMRPNHELWSNRYTARSGSWGAAEPVGIGVEGLGDAQAPRVAIDGDGNAHAVWQLVETMTQTQDVWTNRSTPNEGWGDAQRLEDDLNPAGAPAIAADASGTAHAVWWQSDGTLQNIWASRYTPGGGWEAPRLIEQPIEDPQDEGSADRPQIAVDPNGNVFVVWQQQDTGRFNIWSNRYAPETGWATAELIEQETFFGTAPQIAVDPNRHAHAVWAQAADTLGMTHIATNRFE
jgi:hypothetical protein